MAKIHWQQESLRDVIKHFKDGYELPEGVKISAEHVIDPVQGIVMIKFIADNDADFDGIAARPKSDE